MAKFRITWASKKQTEEECSTECETVEAFINQRFGSVDPYEHGAKIEIVIDEPVVEVVPIEVDEEDEEEEE